MTDPLSFTIRGAEQRDADGLAALSNCPGYRFGTLRLPFETADAVRRRLLGEHPSMTLLVAEAEGRIVGSASLQRHAGRRAHVGAIGMGVHDDHRRRGIGRALLAALIELADDWLGLVRLELEVNVDNAAAIALYEHFGFKVEGRARQAILRQGVLVDTFSMARLRPAPGPAAAA